MTVATWVRRQAGRWLGRWGRAVRWLEEVVPAPTRVVDIGCAFGFGTARLRASGRWVVGVESDWGYVHRARRAYPDLPLVQGTATALPIRSGSCDGAVLLDVLEHVSDPESAGAEIGRVLRTGGTAVVTVPRAGPTAWADSLNCYQAMRTRNRAWLPLDASEIVVGQVHRHFTENELGRLLAPDLIVTRVARSGFGIVSELVHLSMLVVCRGLLRSEAAYRILRNLYFVLVVADEAIPAGWFGYNLAIRAHRR